ncbi:MAG: hypothetical protein ACT60Q_00425 [Ferrovibrionaceae bacterium]
MQTIMARDEWTSMSALRSPPGSGPTDRPDEEARRAAMASDFPREAVRAAMRAASRMPEEPSADEDDGELSLEDIILARAAAGDVDIVHLTLDIETVVVDTPGPGVTMTFEFSPDTPPPDSPEPRACTVWPITVIDKTSG